MTQPSAPEAAPFGTDPVALGPAVLDYLQRVMGIDSEWSIRSERELTWWPHTYKQIIVAEPPIEDEGLTLTPFACRTEILEAMPESPRLYETLSLVNQFSSLASLIYDPDTRTVASTSRVHIHTDSTWLAQFLQAAAAIQLNQVEQLGPFWEEQLGGRFVRSAHPDSGLRKYPDEIVNVVENLFAPAGQSESPFLGLVDAVDRLPHKWSTLERSKDRLVAEVRFRDAVPMEERIAKGEPVNTGLLKVTTDEKHPTLGHGLIIALSLPIATDEGVHHMGANMNNYMEAQGPVHLQMLGSWTAAELLQFRTFVPALLAQNHDAAWRIQLVHTFMLYAMARAEVFGGLLRKQSLFARPSLSKRPSPRPNLDASALQRSGDTIASYAQVLNETIFAARKRFERDAPAGDQGELFLELTGLMLNATNQALKELGLEDELRQATLLKLIELFLVKVMGDPNGLDPAVRENKRRIYDLLVQHERRWASTWHDLVAQGTVDQLKQEFELYRWDSPTPIDKTAFVAYPTFMAVQFARSMEKPSALPAQGAVQVLADIVGGCLTAARPDRFAAEIAMRDRAQVLAETLSPIGRFL